jgi:acyl carrier protein
MLRGEEREKRIRAIVARLGRHEDPDAINPRADVYRSLGIVSTGALDLLLSIEEELGVHLPDAEFNEARTIEELLALVARREES